MPLYYLCTLTMCWRGRYVIENIADIRRRYREIALEPGPLLICANHLTFIDSAIILWACGSGTWYLRHFHRFSWNLPAGDFFNKKLFHRFMGTISKCLFIYRNGSKDHKESVLKLCTQLLAGGDVVTVFPEGKRSRSGRFEEAKLTYGVGKMVVELGGHCRVLCLYVRSDKQDGHSNYPRRGSRFRIGMELVEARTSQSGRDGYSEVVGQIGRTLRALEDAYFAP